MLKQKIQESDLSYYKLNLYGNFPSLLCDKVIYVQECVGDHINEP